MHVASSIKKLAKANIKVGHVNPCCMIFYKYIGTTNLCRLSCMGGVIIFLLLFYPLEKGSNRVENAEIFYSIWQHDEVLRRFLNTTLAYYPSLNM